MIGQVGDGAFCVGEAEILQRIAEETEGLQEKELVRRVLTVEVKAAKTYHELEQVSQVALRQIQEKQYVSGISPQIRKIIFYGIAFWKKESSVQVLEFNR